jgi:ATP-binding cassette, subfamily B, bacterial
MWAKVLHLLSLARGQSLRYAMAAVFLFAGVLLYYAGPLLTGLTVDRVLGKGETSRLAELLGQFGILDLLPQQLPALALLVVCLTLVGGVFTFGKMRLGAQAAESVARKLRETLFDHLQKLPATYHDSAQTGDLVQRCSSDVETVRMFFADQILEILRATVLIGVALPIMLMIDVKLALSAVCVMPVVVLFAVIFFWKVHGTFKAMDEAEGAMTTSIQENLTGIRVVRAFARGDHERGKFAVRNDDHRAKHWSLYKVLAVYWSSSDFMCFAQIVIYVVYGAYRLSLNQITPGELATFMMITGMYIFPVRHMGRIITECGKALVAIGRIREVLDAPEESNDGADAPTRFHGRIAFDNVGFRHRGKQVLHDISFDVPAGSTVALLGASGSGKTTIAQLLMRLYDPSSGAIRIDDIDIASLKRSEVRRQIGVVMQEPFLFSRTIADNIRFSRPDADHEAIVSAASMAAVDASIRGFEKQYDTLLGERGVTLSGGQRQRVAIARAVLREAPILILDDALSAVDTETEASILSALRNTGRKQTTLLIAHRLSTLMHADQILVLEHGRIVQRGTHESLSSEQGLYRKLWTIQSELEEDLKSELDEPADANASMPAAR